MLKYNFIEVCTDYYTITCYFKFSPATACIRQFLPGKRTFYGRVLVSTPCVALLRKTADEMSITIFSSPSEKRKGMSL
jgi:hypothetical protein